MSDELGPWDPPPSEPRGDEERALRSWVAWFVDAYEAWSIVPRCWAQHPAMVNELRTARDLTLGVEQASIDAPDVLATARLEVEWHDFRGRMFHRFSGSPGAVCAERRSHRYPTKWDKAEASRIRHQRHRTTGAEVWSETEDG